MNLPTSRSLLKIGDIAATSGLSVKTIRYYEEIGLLVPTVARSASGYRLFDPAVVERLAFIKRAQSLGLSLMEIREILLVHDRGEIPCGEVKQHLQERLEQVNQQLRELTALKSELQALLSDWQEQPPTEQLADAICPNIQTDDWVPDEPLAGVKNAR